MKRFLSLALLLLAQTGLLADGKVIPATAFPAEVTIPDQRALIHFSDGTERLVIETRFTGEGTNFCWVVPLPAEPVIEEATSGLFATLQYLLQPELVHNRMALFPLFTVVLIFVSLLVMVRSDVDPVFLWIPAAAALALAFYSVPIALMAFTMVVWAFDRLLGGDVTLVKLLAVVVIVAVLYAMLLPSLGGGLASHSADITATSHGRIGVFDVTTVTSKNPGALFDWLQQNGFQAPEGAKDIVEDYVTEGWVFAVARLHRETTDQATNAVHPLSFTFKSSQPIYPMRLTGVGADRLKVDLYVAGSGRATAKHFKVRQCAPVVAKSTSSFRTRANELPLQHPLLSGWLQGSSAITKLSADLKGNAMKEDVQIAWEPFVPYRTKVYSRKGAATVAADWALGLMLVGGIAVLVIFGKQKSLLRRLAQLLALSALVFSACYLALPKLAVRTTRLPTLRSQANSTRLGSEVLQAWTKNAPASLSEARQIAAATAAKFKPGDNFLLGGNIHEEDSPGNYVIRQSTNGFKFVWFRADGSEDSLPYILQAD